MRTAILFLFLYSSAISIAQVSKVTGRVYNSINNEAIPFAKITVINAQAGAMTEDNGVYVIEGLQPGIYSFKTTVPGFQDLLINDITVTISRTVDLDFALEPIVKEQKEVTVKASPFNRKVESPVSLRTLNATEIERQPGAGRDVSKVLQALPGVGVRATFRNDIIIRGGAPGENKFYLDGIEVPNINHFATQGSSGGPVGLLNVKFIREVDFYAGAFPANRANGLSSVISFKQKDGNPDALITNFALGSSDAALTFDGPLGKKADFIFSARRSYLQFLFAALQLPFLPTYNDAQFKVNLKLNQKNRITIIGLGALDDFVLNTKVNDKVTDTETREYNEFILGNIPTQDQWNYTFGVNWLHYSKNSYQNIIASRNMLKNIATRYANNIENEANKLLDYSSFEAENKFRFEHNINRNGWKLNAGFGYEYARYNNETFNRISVQGTPVTIDYESDLYLSKGALFAQLSKAFISDRLNLSAGIRSDFNNYSNSMMNPLEQLSPMFSASYRVTEKFSINGNIARFHQLPAYTILGYRDAAGELVNKNNGIKYIRADHFVLGTEYLTEFSSRFTLEGFYKNYSRYPFSVKDSISLANLGSDFGVLGNEEVVSSSLGRSYGIEFLYQQKLIKGFYGIVAYTFVNSEFQDKNGTYISSSWDSKHIVSLTAGKRFNKGWEVGMRWLYSGGSPYTPVDVTTSSLKEVWDVTGQGVPNYSLLNSQREASFHQLNIRVDKKIYLNKFSMNFYLDIQNAYAYKTKVAPILLLVKDENGNPLT
ncbi:MAG: carboxypeptidase regulatory-like domain-containing protein, partial [Flavobacteriia bacterium]